MSSSQLCCFNRVYRRSSRDAWMAALRASICPGEKTRRKVSMLKQKNFEEFFLKVEMTGGGGGLGYVHDPIIAPPLHPQIPPTPTFRRYCQAFHIVF